MQTVVQVNYNRTLFKCKRINTDKLRKVDVTAEILYSNNKKLLYLLNLEVFGV